MEVWVIIAIVVMLLLLAAWAVMRGGSGRRKESRGDDARLDTIAAWPPSATRILTTSERLAYATLVRAMPGHMVLAQVPLARFLKVPTRHSYAEWLRRLGNQCADFVICDMSSEVIAVVNVQPPADRVSDRGRKRQNRMAKVLKAAQIPMHVWTDNALPSSETARELLLPKRSEGAEASPTGPSPVAGTDNRPSRPTPFDAEDRDSSQDETIEVREPPPSTWFDEFNSGPTPLGENKRPRQR